MILEKNKQTKAYVEILYKNFCLITQNQHLDGFQLMESWRLTRKSLQMCSAFFTSIGEKLANNITAVPDKRC